MTPYGIRYLKSTLDQVMVCCLMAPSNYLNQCWLIISKVQRHLIAISQSIPQLSTTEITLKITYLKFNSNLPGANELRGMVVFVLLHDDIIKWKHFTNYWPFCEGNPPVTCGFPSQRPVKPSFDVFLDQQLSKQSGRQWFEKPSFSLWCHCNGKGLFIQYLVCYFCRLFSWLLHNLGNRCQNTTCTITQTVSQPSPYIILYVNKNVTYNLMIQTSKLKPAYPKKDWISTKSMNRNASITHGLIVLVNFTFIPMVKLINTMNQFLRHSLTLENGEMSDIIMLIWFALSKQLMKIQQIQWCQLVFPSGKWNIVEKTVFSQSFHPHGIFHNNEAYMMQK